jgi:hypothetical protein
VAADGLFGAHAGNIDEDVDLAEGVDGGGVQPTAPPPRAMIS